LILNDAVAGGISDSETIVGGGMLIGGRDVSMTILTVSTRRESLSISTGNADPGKPQRQIKKAVTAANLSSDVRSSVSFLLCRRETRPGVAGHNPLPPNIFYLIITLK